ncbi:unnamed protein product [Rhizophagus irregularis]|nr:unnamed protein product [Rhizophagus irregularis]
MYVPQPFSIFFTICSNGKDVASRNHNSNSVLLIFTIAPAIRTDNSAFPQHIHLLESVIVKLKLYTHRVSNKPEGTASTKGVIIGTARLYTGMRTTLHVQNGGTPHEGRVAVYVHVQAMKAPTHEQVSLFGIKVLNT